MSRIGKQYITIPEKVEVKLEGQKVYVNGPKGNLSRILPSFICCTLNDTRLTHHLSLGSDSAQSYSFISEDATTPPNHPPHHVGFH